MIYSTSPLAERLGLQRVVAVATVDADLKAECRAHTGHDVELLHAPARVSADDATGWAGCSADRSSSTSPAEKGSKGTWTRYSSQPLTAFRAAIRSTDNRSCLYALRIWLTQPPSWMFSPQNVRE
jgi:hypothetical protein